MKIKVEKLNITDTEPDYILKEICSVLKNARYNIIKKTNSLIVFDDEVYSLFKLVSRSEAYYKIHDGKFEITTHGKGINVSLSTDANVSFEMIIGLAGLVMGFFQLYYFYFVFLIMLINVVSKLIVLKRKSENMLSLVVK